MKVRRTRFIALVAVSCTLPACSAVEKAVSAVTGGGSCNGPVTVTTSGTVSGTTNGAACKFPDGSQGNVYALTAAQSTNVEVSVTPNGFQPWLGAWAANGTMLAQTNTSPWKHKLFLAPGSYQFGVSAVGSKDGSFTLVTAPAEITACKGGPGTNVSAEDVGVTMKGAVITGAVTNSDCGGGTRRNDGYTLAGATAGSTWTFTVTVDRAADIGVWVGSNSVASKSINNAGTMTVTAAGTADPTFRVFIGGAPGTGAINYTLTIN